jgi:hypothetical protein
MKTVNPESKYHNYSRYGSMAISIGGLLMVCSFIYFIVLQKRTAAAQKKSSDSVITALKQVLHKDSVNDTLRSVLSQKLNENNVKNNPGDIRLLSQSSITAAEAIIPNHPVDDHFWVYLGQKIGKKWNIKNFQFPDIPLPDSFVPLTASLYTRQGLPLKINMNKWRLGEIIGAVTDGTVLKIDSIKKVEGEHYWACAESYNWLSVLDGSSTLQQAQQKFNNFKNAGIATLIVYRNNSYRNVSLPFKNKKDATLLLSKYHDRVPADAYIVKLSSWSPKLGYNGIYYTDERTPEPAIFKTDFIRTNIEFIYNGEYIPNLDGSILDARHHNIRENPNSQFKETNDQDRKLNWTAYLAKGRYKIILNDSKYKIMKNNSWFSYTQAEVNIGYTTKVIPLQLK